MPGMPPRMRFSISGWLFDNSAISASPQPNRAAPSSIAAAIAVVPLVIPAYDILRPEAAPTGPSITRQSIPQSRSTAVSPAAAPAEERADLGALFMEALSDPRAHAALRNDGNGDAHDYPIRKTKPLFLGGRVIARGRSFQLSSRRRPGSIWQSCGRLKHGSRP